MAEAVWNSNTLARKLLQLHPLVLISYNPWDKHIAYAGADL